MPKAPELLKLDAMCRGQLSMREPGDGEGNAFGENSGPDDALAGACPKEGRGSISLLGDNWQLLVPVSTEREGEMLSVSISESWQSS